MRAKILEPTAENIQLAAQALGRGEVVGFPTETVYGLAGAALNPKALALIFDTKERPTFDPLIVHVGPESKAPAGQSSLERLSELQLIDLAALSELARGRAEQLIQTFWPGPLTLVLPKHARVPELATSGLPSVALRMPAHPIAQKILAAANTPLAAPSANRFGRISPTSAQAVAEELGDRIDWIVDGGTCDIGVESTVLLVEPQGELRLLRPGGISRARIEESLRCVVRLPEPSTTGAPSNSTAPTASPGMLESHYAPRKPLILLPAAASLLEHDQWQNVARAAAALGLPKSVTVGLLLQSAPPQYDFKDRITAKLRAAGLFVAQAVIHSMSGDGELSEIARNLFSSMRSLDASEAHLLLAEPCLSPQGLGHAISDRLTRASKIKIARSSS